MALGLFEIGAEMMPQRLRRDHPGLADHEVEARLGSWLRERQGSTETGATRNQASRPGFVRGVPAGGQCPSTGFLSPTISGAAVVVT